jgi:hypothetical protein
MIDVFSAFVMLEIIRVAGVGLTGFCDKRDGLMGGRIIRSREFLSPFPVDWEIDVPGPVPSLIF